MAPGSGGGEDGIDHQSAKHLLDSIGQKVYKEKVKSESNGFKDELKGNLQEAASTSLETVAFSDTCNLVQEYYKHTNGGGNGDPCTNLKGNTNEERFSNTLGGQCTNKKMRSGGKGACAPYRRLHLCHHNLETINNTTSTKHDLLAEVCYAAKYEGQSIKTHYTKYKESNPGTASQLCTVLARSFADIGDIVRGKDLFYGNTHEKEKRDKLEENLKEIFQQIHSGLTDGVKSRYKEDPDKNYSKLREDWWTANRHTVWEAITCNDDKKLKDASYFRTTCSDEQGGAQANNKCRCVKNDVPTYFDYVPQYLRWFEEWAEDFCRKKKKKVENVKKQCRGPSGTDKYCSRNGCDCTKTVRAKGKLRYGNQCTKCFFACYPYEKWIDKKKEEFDKQKNKYETEISDGGASGGRSGNGRQKRGARGATTKVYDGYEKIFYEKLKDNGKYSDVKNFLELLSKEKTCKDITDGGTINFKEVNSGGTAGSASVPGGGTSGDSGTNNENEGTFYRSKYCQPCPHCGMKRKSDGSGWEEKSVDENCTRGKLYKPKKGATPTEIIILKSGEGHDDIAEKLNKFCLTQNGTGGVANGNGTSDSQKLYQEWKCYKGEDVEKVENKDEEDDDEEDVQKVKDAGGLCILKNKNKKEKPETNSEKEPEQFQKTYNDFFNIWVAHMLKDSIYWRTKKIKGCLKNGTTIKCKDGCKNPCKCYESWVKQKKDQEWTKIKEHFKTQDISTTVRMGDIVVSFLLDNDDLLKKVLEKDVLLTSLQEGYGNVKELKGIEALLNDEEEAEAGETDDEKKNTIDKLLEHEDKDAKGCIEKHNEEKCKEQAKENLARADQQPQPPVIPRNHSEDENELSDDGEDEENDDEDDEDGEEEEEEETKEEVEDTLEEPQGPKVEDICKTVAEALKGKLDDACNLKYGSKSHVGWKCVPTTSGDEKTTKSSDSGDTTTSSGGAICIPPRRRRLYVGKLEEWANKHNTEAKSQETSTDQKTPSGEKLREAFIESAAVETFFLWDRYKKEWALQHGAGHGLSLLEPSPPSENPQTKLKRGDIPNDFLRQMFYTLGDYRDICIGKTPDGIDTNGKDTMQKIQNKIKNVIENSGTTTPPKTGKPSVENPRETLWSKYAEPIWHGMICALTYKEEKGTPQVDDDVKRALLDTEGKKPKEDGNYTYEKVVLKEDDGGAKVVGSSNEPPPTLKDFVEIPTFFRYLHEWGETFCRQRARMLKDVKTNCLDKNGGKKCSGDGFDCDDESPNKDEIFEDFLCPTCARHCRFYKKWIKIKKIEFDEQKKAYVEQQKKYEDESNGAGRNNDDKQFCVKLGTCTTAGDFLQKLKKGPCKNNENGVGKKGEDEINFNDEDKTFKHTEYCDPCSEFKIDCQKANCTGANANTCTTGKITAEDIKNKTDPNGNIEMVVSDNGATEFNDLKVCEGKGIFKGIRKDVWECGEYCGVHVCTLEKKNNGTVVHEHITVKELIKRWLETFFEDYNRIKKKLNACIQNRNGEEHKCFKGCKEKCDCVDKWIKLKRTEWDNIKKRYLQQYNVIASNDYKLTSFLETLIPQITDANDEEKVIKLSVFDNSCGCSADAHEQNKNGHKDAIECMLQKLQKKIDDCKNKPSGTDCSQEQTLDLNVETFDDDIETDDAKNMIPKICGEMTTTEEQTNTEETCDAPPAEEKKEKEKEEQEERDTKTEEPSGKPTEPKTRPQPEDQTNEIPVLKPEEGTPSRPKPPQIVDKTPALVTSTLAWSVGIGFAAFTYFYLKVLYIYIWMWIYVFLYMYVFVCLHIYMFVCICISVYVCVLYIFYIYLCIYIEKKKK